MIVTDLFRPRVVAEALEQPITTGFLNPATGKPYLPSELAAKRQQRAIAAGRLDAPQPTTADPAAEAEQIRKAKQAAAAQAAQDQMDGKAPAAGAGAFGAMAQQLGGPAPANTMANAPVSSTNVAKPGNPNAASTAAPVAATASTPTVPSLTSAPAKVEPLTPAATAPAKPEPISIGGQTIKPTDPLYAQIMQNAPAGTFDAPEAAPAPATNVAPDLTGAERAVVKDIALKASDMLKTVQNKDDLAKVKAFIDREFAKQGTMSEAVFFNRDRLMEQATRIYHRRIS